MTGKGNNGFTLIEVMVALAIFSMAALALLRLQGMTAVNAGGLADREVAAIVASNIVVEALTSQNPPPFGTVRGEEKNVGQSWRWTRTVTSLPDARFQRIDVDVHAPDGSSFGVWTSVRRLF